jgi:general secretion pathway protein G
VRPSLTFWFLLAILGILLYAIVTPKIGSVGSDPRGARIAAAHADIYGGIKVALDSFKVDTGHYPKGSNGLLELVQQPSGTTNWHGPYFDPPKLPVDPWGNKYFYEYPGKHNTNGYDLFSAGPDGKAGTEDDIGNWAK